MREMWALLLIIMPGKRDWVVWYQIEVCEELGYVWIHLGAFEIRYSKLIGWEIEGREVIRLSSCEPLDGEIVSHVAVKTCIMPPIWLGYGICLVVIVFIYHV
jgi:hypothetical protein